MSNKVTVYYFKAWNPAAGESTASTRPATLDAIERARGEAILDTAMEVDEADLDGDGFLRQEGSAGN